MEKPNTTERLKIAVASIFTEFLAANIAAGISIVLYECCLRQIVLDAATGIRMKALKNK